MRWPGLRLVGGRATLILVLFLSAEWDSEVLGQDQQSQLKERSQVHQEQNLGRDGAGLGEESGQASSSFDVMIMGTIVSKDPQKSVALVKEVQSKKVKALKPGYLLLDKHLVVAIKKDHIVVQDHLKRQVTLYKDSFAAGKTKGLVADSGKSSGGSRDSNEFSEDGLSRKTENGEIDVQVSAAYRDNMVNNQLQTILMEAAATPHIREGKIHGFLLTDITPGSIYEKAGFENGDIITTINAVPLNSAGGAIKVLNELKGADSVDVNILRSGQDMAMTIAVQ